MSRVEGLLNSLLVKSAETDPILVTILQELLGEIRRLGLEIDPAPIVQKKASAGLTGKPSVVDSFSYEFTENNVILKWVPRGNQITYFELRKGVNWDNADRIIFTASDRVYLDPLPVGIHYYLLKSFNEKGYSEETATLTIVVPEITGVAILPYSVANSVTITWTVPTSTFKISHYIIQRNLVTIATTAGTFYATSEEIAGTYTYSVIPVDIYGNLGPRSDSIVVTTGIIDYIFFDRRTSILDGTAVNAKSEGDRLYIAIATETYQNHFTTRSWASPQAQIGAGYSLWLSPFATTASYEETFDFGVIISNVIVNLSWIFEVLAGTFTFGLDIKTSNDGSSWSTPYNSPSFYVTSVRYVKAKINFTAANDKSLMTMKDLICSLNVKRENDGGFSTALASDVNGTVVSFTKTFVDVESITVSPISTTSVFAVFEFTDAPFPTNFKVKVYDNAGVRVTRDFRWDARGIV